MDNKFHDLLISIESRLTSLETKMKLILWSLGTIGGVLITTRISGCM